MRSPLLIWVLALVMSLCTAPRLQAGELRKDWLPANASWVAHLDLEAVSHSVLGQAAVGWLENEPRLSPQLRAFQGKYLLHPMRDLRQVTLYGTASARGDMVAIFVASPALASLEARVREHPRHTRQKLEGLELHTWAMGESSPEAPLLAWFGASDQEDERLVVLADRADLLVAAVGLVRGGPGSLATAERAPLSANPIPGCTFYLEAGRGLPDLLGRLPDSRVARQARRARVMLGETQGRAWARVRIATGSRANARDVADVLRGGLGLLRVGLRGGLSPELALRVDQVRVEEHQKDVLLGFEGRAAALAFELAGAIQRWPSLESEAAPEDVESK
jgi:hypothetical protein